MIHAKDLTIGDWVNVTAAENIVPPGILSILPKKGKVVGIDGECIYMDFINHPFMFGDIEPIPLSPEILEKNEIKLLEVGDNGVATPAKYRNRYEKWQIYTQWKDTYLWYDRTTKRWNLHDMNAAQFTFVHELQHALRLCGIEKEITI